MFTFPYEYELDLKAVSSRQTQWCKFPASEYRDFFIFVEILITPNRYMANRVTTLERRDQRYKETFPEALSFREGISSVACEDKSRQVIFTRGYS
jgi:hypothetical protein